MERLPIIKITSGAALFAAVPMLKMSRAGGAASGQSGASLFLAKTAWKSTERLVRSFILQHIDKYYPYIFQIRNNIPF